jgi:putative redox protein
MVRLVRFPVRVRLYDGAMERIVTARRVAERAFAMETWFGHTVAAESGAPDPAVAAGAAPMELLLAGLAACAADTFTQILAKMRVPFTDVRVHVSGERAPTPPRVWAAIHYGIEVVGDVPEDRAKRALALVARTCPASVMLAKAAEVTSSVEVLAPSGI